MIADNNWIGSIYGLFVLVFSLDKCTESIEPLISDDENGDADKREEDELEDEDDDDEEEELPTIPVEDEDLLQLSQLTTGPCDKFSNEL